MRIKNILLLLLIFFFEKNSFTQNSNILFKQYTVDDGLSQNTVNCILKDKKGFMWFGTEDGLNQFDGYNFRTFKNNSKDTNSISSNLIKSIHEDSQGRLWVGTWNGGINLYNRETNSFRRFLHNDNDSNSLAGNNIAFIFEDSKGTIWIGTQKSGLSRLIATDNGEYTFENYMYKNETNSGSISVLTIMYEDSNQNLWVGTESGGLHLLIKSKKGDFRFENYPMCGKNCDNSKQNFITSICEDSEGLIWVGTDNSGLYSINLNGNERDSVLNFTHNINDKQSISSNSIKYIFEDSNKNLWIGSTYMGLSLYSKNSRTFTNFSHDIKDASSFGGNAVITILEDKDGELWIATGGNGISMLNQEDNTFVNYKHIENNNSSLSNNIINCLYEDSEGNIWIGTRAGGVSLANKFSSVFRHYKNDPLNPASLVNNLVLSFCEDTDGYIWVGTDGGGVSRFDRETNSFKHYQYMNIPGGISHNVVLSIYEDKQDSLWFGTWTGSINLYNKETETFSSYPHNPEDSNSISSPNVWSIFEDSKGTFWVGTCCNGLNIFNKEKGTFSYFETNENDENSLAGNCVWTLYEDSRNNLWIGTSSGLSKLNRDEYGKHSFSNYKHADSNKHSISNNWVWSLFEDSDNNLWLGTNGGGLNLFDRDREEFISFTEDDGLPNNVVFGILEDNNKNLWLSTNHGLSRFNTRTKTFKNFDTDNGLKSNQFNSSAWLKSRNGEMYFGGANGFYVFHPDSIKSNQQIPPIVITDFKLFNKPVDIAGENSPLKKNISETKEITLSYKQSSISFEFVALNYISSEKNEYAYMLEGFEPSWNYVGAKRTASYTNLDPGRYTFRVKGSNNDLIWNEKGASITIIITPPYWQTWWFRLLILTVIITLLLWIYYFRVRQVNKLNILLKEKVDQRTLEINRQNKLLREQAEELTAQRDQLSDTNAVKDKLFSIVAHDLKNPFNSIIGFSEMLNMQYDSLDEKKRKQLVNFIYESSERVFGLLENLLAWSRAQQGVIHFDPEKINLTRLVEQSIDLVTDQANKKQIKIELKSYSPIMEVIIDSDLINIVIRNLLTNAIKFSKENSQITITTSVTDNESIVAVKDTGIGVSQENIKKLFVKNLHFTTAGTKNEGGTGIGLSLCKDFVEKHGGEIWVDSEEGKGATFSFSIPNDLSSS